VGAYRPTTTTIGLLRRLDDLVSPKRHRQWNTYIHCKNPNTKEHGSNARNPVARSTTKQLTALINERARPMNERAQRDLRASRANVDHGSRETWKLLIDHWLTGCV